MLPAASFWSGKKDEERGRTGEKGGMEETARSALAPRSSPVYCRKTFASDENARCPAREAGRRGAAFESSLVLCDRQIFLVTNPRAIQRPTDLCWRPLLTVALTGAVFIACQHEMKRTPAPVTSTQRVTQFAPEASDSPERREEAKQEAKVETGELRSADPSSVA